ncbi:hypothetical protein KUW09_04915 [Mameliella alba]|nr:hypothetical protein [Antarctobacter heliothermus]MBY6143370.1 hypothetical protein [Mameliella alba]MBY6164192.1 hypothetical protein [Mameliella alba]MBY6172692.1 hypothetical protein [Mameliella alba]MBY6177679.1 hypothetical protein [Mameliella alba]
MASEVQEYRLLQAEKQLEAQAGQIDALKAEIAEVRHAEEERERKRLVWGISSLGSILMILAGVIWSYRGVIFK